MKLSEFRVARQGKGGKHHLNPQTPTLVQNHVDSSKGKERIEACQKEEEIIGAVRYGKVGDLE